jgi:hypothetical protein
LKMYPSKRPNRNMYARLVSIWVQIYYFFMQLGCRSHLFSHVTGCVVVWCEMFALFVGQGRLQVSPFFTCCWLCGGLV